MKFALTVLTDATPTNDETENNIIVVSASAVFFTAVPDNTRSLHVKRSSCKDFLTKCACYSVKVS